MTDPERGSGYEKCGAERKHGQGPCTRPAGWGTDHPGIGRCKLHGGSTPSHVAAATTEAIRREVDRMGLEVRVDATEALLTALWRTAGDVEYLAHRVSELESQVLAVETGPAGAKKVVTHPIVSLYGEKVTLLASISSKCISLGLEERRVRMVEADARRLFGAVATALARAGIAPDVAETFRHELATELRRLEEAR